jgi:hypothetical protein
MSFIEMLAFSWSRHHRFDVQKIFPKILEMVSKVASSTDCATTISPAARSYFERLSACAALSGPLAPANDTEKLILS